MTDKMILNINPMPKPRMVKSDAWKKRPCVIRYWSFKDEVVLLAKGYQVPKAVVLVFVMKMPNSWSKKYQAFMKGKPHQQTPDIDNLVKAIFDCLVENDSYIHTVYAKKIWGEQGQIMIRDLEDVL